MLEATTTRRDAKAYLNRFARTVEAEATNAPSLSSQPRVNLGSLFAANETSSLQGWGELFEPQHGQAPHEQGSMHIAIIKLRALTSVSDDQLSAVGRTIAQLATLGMQGVVVLEPSESRPSEDHEHRIRFDSQVCRVVDIFNDSRDNESEEKLRAQRVDHIFEMTNDVRKATKSTMQKPPINVRIANTDLFWSLLRRGIVPIVAPLAASFDRGVRSVEVDADSLIVALAKNLHGVRPRFPKDKKSKKRRDIDLEPQLISMSFDRIIILDPAGGIPSADRSHAPHVYINMKQEYKDIKHQLQQYPLGIMDESAKNVHIRNLELLRNSLEGLPNSSSGLIVAPEDVASTRPMPAEEFSPQVQTRSKRNPLIHNLLTDKPSISSSLPYGRSSGLGFGGPTSTFVKRGMPLTTVPDVFAAPWSPPSSSQPKPCIFDPSIDMGKLVRLIEASFGKKLDVDRYLARISECFAGLVIAGDYEGCALFTWESSPAAPTIKVPYLDKFAVLPQSQGTGASVADILFTCMIMDCFPRGVCWRSRVKNPVNKWYFERAKGAWKLPGNKWTSFWTTDTPSKKELKAYEDICSNIPPTWPS